MQLSRNNVIFKKRNENSVLEWSAGFPKFYETNTGCLLVASVSRAVKKKKKKSPSFSTHKETLSKTEENGNTALPSTGFFLKIPLYFQHRGQQSRAG